MKSDENMEKTRVIKWGIFGVAVVAIIVLLFVYVKVPPVAQVTDWEIKADGTVAYLYFDYESKDMLKAELVDPEGHITGTTMISPMGVRAKLPACADRESVKPGQYTLRFLDPFGNVVYQKEIEIYGPSVEVNNVKIRYYGSQSSNYIDNITIEFENTGDSPLYIHKIIGKINGEEQLNAYVSRYVNCGISTLSMNVYSNPIPSGTHDLVLEFIDENDSVILTKTVQIYV